MQFKPGAENLEQSLLSAVYWQAALADTDLKNPVELVGWLVELSTAGLGPCQRAEPGTAPSRPASGAPTAAANIGATKVPFLRHCWVLGGANKLPMMARGVQK